MRKIICIILSVILFMSSLANVFAEEAMEDDSILYATRKEAFDFISHILDYGEWFNNAGVNYNEDEKKLEAFSDINEYRSLGSDGYDELFLLFAVDNGIINGYEDGTIRPKGKITRGEFATILYKVSKFDKDAPEELIPLPTSYADVSDWSREGIDFCFKRGIMIGYGDRFGCNDHISKFQLGIIEDRYESGLNFFEKYSTLDKAGLSPINMSKVIESANVPEMVKPFNDQMSTDAPQQLMHSFQKYVEYWIPENQGFEKGKAPMFLVTLPQNGIDLDHHVYEDGKFILKDDLEYRQEIVDGYLYYIDEQDLINKRCENMYRLRAKITRIEKVLQFRPHFQVDIKWKIDRGEKEPIPQDYFYSDGR